MVNFGNRSNCLTPYPNRDGWIKQQQQIFSLKADFSNLACL